MLTLPVRLAHKKEGLMDFREIDRMALLNVFEPEDDNPITAFVENVVNETDDAKKFQESADKMRNIVHEATGEWIDIGGMALDYALKYHELTALVFFVLGRTFDIFDPDALETLRCLEDELREKRVLPYWPRKLTPNTPSAPVL